MRKKKFDCVEMQHQGAARILAHLSNMRREEQIAYWEKGSQELLQRQRAARRKRQSAAG